MDAIIRTGCPAQTGWIRPRADASSASPIVVTLWTWNYGECRPLSRREMEHQLETYARWMERGALEGVVVCSNCTADLGLESVDLLRSWLAAVGERPACRPKPTT